MDASSDSNRTGLVPVILVLGLALALRGMVIARTEVAARDSVGFITTALRYESEPFLDVLRTAQQPPGYPLAILAVSRPIRAIDGQVTPENMTLAAQVASGIFGVLLVLPMIAFGAELVDRRFGVIAAALFQCLPAWVRFTSDGLSEGMFLFFVASSLWLSARAFRTGRVGGFALAGLASGAAYLTRPEGAEVAVAIAVVLFGLTLMRQMNWRASLLRSSAVAIGLLVCMGPYYAATGRVTNKPTGRFLMGDPTAEKSFFGMSATPLPLAAWWQDMGDPHRNRTLWAAKTLVTETAASSQQLGLALSLIGLWCWSRRLRNHAGGAVLIVLSTLHAALLIRMTSSVGYLSERHTAIIVLTGCYPATVGLLELVGWLCNRSPKLRTDAVVATSIFLASLVALPSLAKPLHGNRAGHRAAGQWIAAHAPRSAGIVDPFCWARFYSGREFVDPRQWDPDVQYVIVEKSDNQHSRLPQLAEARAKANAGELVYHWPDTKPVERAFVEVYRWVRPPGSPTASRTSPAADRDASGRTATGSP